jgi:hypothetical protein
MKTKLIIMIILFAVTSINSQGKLPYREIPMMKESYTAQNTVARMIDGLGFRYYWATERRGQRLSANCKSFVRLIKYDAAPHQDRF